MYPKYKHHPAKPAVVVEDAKEEKALGKGWYESPAEYGVETCPGELPDSEIAALAESDSKPSKGAKAAPSEQDGE